jgi:CarD family transcriptional regulator
MPSVKKSISKKMASKKIQARRTSPSTSRRATPIRKASKRSLSITKRKAPSSHGSVKLKIKKPITSNANKQTKKTEKKMDKKVLKAKTPLKTLNKGHFRVEAQKAFNKKQAANAALVKAKTAESLKPPAAPKIVGTMLAKPGLPQPPAKTERFSTTASPVKSAGNSKIGYKVNEYVVYPTHGVGQIVSIEEQQIAGLKLELFVVFFAKDRMMLRVPVGKIASVGMRKISESGLAGKALETLKGRPRIKRTMWSRRAQEYEAKINSGDLISVAEVVRDLYRADTQPEQSYSERQLFEAALDRLVREIAVVNKTGEAEALQIVETALQKSPRRNRIAAPASEDENNIVPFKKKASNDDTAAEEEQAA